MEKNRNKENAMLKIYNTLTRKKEDFKPLVDGKINMYVCGPTVYDVPHIGHVRSAYIFDVIRRYLGYSDYEVNFVRNVTDVDDKIINKAVTELQELGEEVTADKLKAKSKDVAVRYLKVYHDELDKFDILIPTDEPKATENIQEMIDFIQVLIDKGYAYSAGKNVYFSIEKFESYGKLSNQNIEQIMHGVRIDSDKNKRHPLDFALWKEVKKDEPFWDSPWGEGRPGWHIECSVMSTRILGNEFDIHGGGLDLIFPHHENEIAQAEAATGKSFAKYWIHNGLLSVNGEKMSKSLGNYITIADFLDKFEDPDILKISFLTSHYRSPMDYSDKKMNEVSHAKERIMIFLDKVERAQIDEADIATGEDCAETIRSIQEKFKQAMDDDFNTPVAMSVIFETIHEGNVKLQEGNVNVAKRFRECVREFTNVLGLSLVPEEVDEGRTEDIERLVTDRQNAKEKKDYAASDRIRDELAAMGVTVEDTPEGPVWRKN